MSGEAGMGREKRGKQTLRKKMMVVMLISAMSSILAVVIVSYMTIRMIRNDSIQESMQIYLEQITRETDSAYYDMISIVNQMSPSGLIGNVVESYLSAEDNFDKYTGQKSLREELVKLGYVNTKLLGVTYYDLEEQSELIRNINVRNLDQVYQTIPNVTENIGNTIQAMHSSCLGIRERPVISVKRRVSFSNRQKLDIYAEIEPDMSVAERLNKENWTYTYMELDENGIVQYSNNPAIIRGQQLLSKLPEKEEYAVTSQEGYKVMVYRSEIGYANAIALQENTYQKEMNMWRLKLLVIILVSFCVFSGSVIYLYRLICKPLNQFQEQLLQIGGVSDIRGGTSNFLCPKYQYVKIGVTDSASGLYVLENTTVRVRDTAYTDATAFKQAMSGVMLYYELANPIVTDISALIPDDFLRNLTVEAGGSVTFKNSNDNYHIPVPSEEEYIVKLSEVGGSV